MQRSVSEVLRSVLRRREISSTKFVLGLAAFQIAVANVAFFSNVLDVYPANSSNAAFLLSLVWVFTSVTAVALALVCHPFTARPIAVAVLLISSVTAYFMDAYNTIIDEEMLQNVVRTDAAEVVDLLSLRLLVYVVFLGLLPAFFVCRTTVRFARPWREVLSRAKLLGFVLGTTFLMAFVLSDYYSSFLREHYALRYYSNPGCWVYATTKYVRGFFKSAALPFRQIGLDARVAKARPERKILIFVVGESARADRFSLNGYERDTNPLLREKDVVSFTDFWSYGTSTAVSVPFMFSVYDNSDFDRAKALATENVLDVVQRAGVNVLWRDNNSTSKGVAERVPNEGFKRRRDNPVCDVECRDVGMLSGLQSYIDARPDGDFLIVLHQKGNHGPAYYKRYPIDFERFTPVCRTNQLQDCSDEEIGNTYDNAILYTDYFLSKVIAFLAQNDDAFDVAMLYVSDHGESLGENGIYLHGLPDFIAPEAQRRVPAVFWMGEAFGRVNMESLRRRSGDAYDHGYVFHSLLGLMEVRTSVYDPDLDLFRDPE